MYVYMYTYMCDPCSLLPPLSIPPFGIRNPRPQPQKFGSNLVFLTLHNELSKQLVLYQI